MKALMNRLVLAALSAVLVMTGLSALSQGASKGFTGKWKGEIPAPTFSPRGGATVPGQRFIQRGRGGGRGGDIGGGFPRGNVGGPQKVTINIKTKDNDTKAVGNIAVGEAIDDIKDGKIDGDKITFKAGSPQIFEYSGTLDGDQIMMTRTLSSTGGRGGQPVQFTLKRS